MKNANVYPHRVAPAVHRPAPGVHLCAPQVPARDFVLKSYVDDLIAKVEKSIKDIVAGDLSPATKEALGEVIIGDGIDVDDQGRISVDTSRIVPWTKTNNGEMRALTVGARAASSAVGDMSVAVGNPVTVSGRMALGVGENVSVKTNHSVGLGHFVGIDGAGCFCWGIRSYVTGDRSCVFGGNITSSDSYAFTWSGNADSSKGIKSSHGDGTFTIYPKGGASGVFIGDSTLVDVIGANSFEPSVSQKSALDSGVTSAKVQQYDKTLNDRRVVITGLNGKFYTMTVLADGKLQLSETDDPSIGGWTPPSIDLTPYDRYYSLVTAELVDGVVILTDRAVNAIRLDSSVTECTFVFPERVKGVARDFMIRLELVGEEIPTLFFEELDGSYVNFDYTDEDWAAVEQGVNIFMFTATKEAE